MRPSLQHLGENFSEIMYKQTNKVYFITRTYLQKNNFSIRDRQFSNQLDPVIVVSTTFKRMGIDVEPTPR